VAISGRFFDFEFSATAGSNAGHVALGFWPDGRALVIIDAARLTGFDL
jgi:hypothetical protein